MLNKNAIVTVCWRLWLSLMILIIASQFMLPNVYAQLSPEQRKLYNKNIFYFEDKECGAASSATTPTAAPSAGNGAPDGAVFPNLPSEAMAIAIDKYIQQTNSSSKLSSLGDTIVASAQKSNISPFLIVAIAQKESGLANPSDFNVKKGNNAFGRTATASQPNFQGAMLWYKWSSMKASVDYTAQENKDANGGGDIAAYLREKYATALDKGDLKSFIDEYAAETPEKNATYVSNAKDSIDKMVQLAQAAGGSAPAATTPATEPAPAAAGTTAPQCCQASSSGSEGGTTSLSGSAVEEQIFNFFVGEGYKPHQAAGIMGNMFEESGLNPRNLQDPKGEADEIEVDGVTGYGLVQWTSIDRQRGLVAFADSKNPRPKTGDLLLQLNYVIKELNTGYKAARDALKNSTNSDQATEAIEVNYERHAGVPSGNLHQIRKTMAAEYLTEYGSGTPASPSGTSVATPVVSSCGASAGGAAGGGAGDPAQPYSGTVKEAAAALLANPGIQIFDDKNLIQQAANGQQTPLDEELIKFLAAMAETHKFGISSLYRGPCNTSNHCAGKAADINPTIDGQTISYTENNPKIQKFIDDAAKLLGTSCENGVPNDEYVNKTKANGSKCEVFLDRGSGPHVHLAVSS